MKKLFTVLALALLFMALPGAACGKSIKAYFNGQEATVTGIVLHPGEQFTVDLYITPDEESWASVELDEPGVTRAYDRLGGDDVFPQDSKPCNASSPAHYRWVMAANGNWVDGNAPVNVYYQIDRPHSNYMVASGYFTVVDAYIAPGAPLATADVPKENVRKVPGPGVLIVLMSILIVLLIRRVAPSQ